MKKIFKKLLLCSTFCGVTLPIVSCGNKSIDDSKTIEIVSIITDVTVMEEESHTSKPVQAKCFGSDKTEKTMDIRFSLTIDGNDTLPNWIYMTDDNKIVLTGGKTAGIYTFKLVAFNDSEKLYSEAKTFTVHVIEERHIMPDSIEMSIEDGKYCMYGESTTLPMRITPIKEGVEEKQLIKSCDFSIEVISGNKLDKLGQPLFKFSDSHIDPNLILSKETDENYSMQYTLKINAWLIDNPNIKVSKEISLNIDNIYYYFDKVNKYTYTRESADEDWTLSLLDSSVKGLTKVATQIQNKPVSKIGANLCSKSQITSLVEIDLPNNIIAIGNNAFADQLTLCLCKMAGVKYVGNNAFKNDSIMEYDNFAKNPDLVYVGNYAFYGCKKFRLTHLYSLEKLGDYSFYNSGLWHFNIGTKCTYIGTEALANCTGLISFDIKATTPPVLAGGTFSQSYGVTSIGVPVKSIDTYKADPCWSALGIDFVGI